MTNAKRDRVIAEYWERGLCGTDIPEAVLDFEWSEVEWFNGWPDTEYLWPDYSDWRNAGRLQTLARLDVFWEGEMAIVTHVSGVSASSEKLEEAIANCAFAIAEAANAKREKE